MGNFLLVAAEAGGRADGWFEGGLALAHRLGFGKPSARVRIPAALLACFPRQNGSGAAFHSDPASGGWILALGTWFHQNDFCTGNEDRLLERYLLVGPQALARELEGFFVVAASHGRSDELDVITDLIGSCHCFLRRGERVMALSGSSLLLAGLDAWELDPVASQEFLGTGIIYEDRTLFREVRKLGPASVFRFSGAALRSEERYWRIMDLEPDSLDGRRAAVALGESLVRAAERVGRRFARPVCDLTGGYDSRATVASFLRAGVPFATTVSGPSTTRDVVVSRSLAETLNLPHLHLDVSEPSSFEQSQSALPLTDGECELGQYARVMEIHRQLSARFDVSINGSYGELARGYWWELLFPWTGSVRPLDTRTLARARFAAEPHDLSLFPPELRLDLADHLARVIERANTGLARLPNTLQMDHAYLVLRMQRWQGRIASSTNRIWPCLSPFLFRSVLETVLQTRSSFRQRSLLIRAMLAELHPILAHFPLEHGYPAAPVKLTNLHRFSPLLVYYGGRALSRLPFGKPSFSEAPSLRLWIGEEVREMLQPRAMWLSQLTGVAPLEGFLARSRMPGFPFLGQWKRLLSLEYVLNRLRTARSEAGSKVGAAR